MKLKGGHIDRLIFDSLIDGVPSVRLGGTDVLVVLEGIAWVH